MSRALLAAVLAAGLLAVPARAQTAALDGGVLTVQGTAARDDFAIVGPASWLAGIQIQAFTTPIAAGPGCVQQSAAIVRCDTALATSIQVDLGDGNDVLVLQTPLPAAAAFGAGDDKDYTLSPDGWGSEGPVFLDGGDGNDALAGGARSDVLRGGDGQDSVNGRQGDDRLDPGAGQDTVMDLSGNDVIVTRDGEPDFVNCGPGSDLATVDAIDRTRACELGRGRRPAGG